MPFKRGQCANPKGRPKGSKNKKDLVREALTKKAVTEGKLPLEFFLEVMRNPKVAMYLRLDAAKAAAPYLHKKQPVAVSVSGNVQHSGVMLVPAAQSLEDWEKATQKAQLRLKEEVRH